MTIIFSSIFLVGLIEFVFVFLFFVPMHVGLRKRCFGFVKQVQERFKFYLCVIYVLIFFVLADAINTTIKGSTIHSNPAPNTIFDPYSHCKTFYAQRNVYLTLFTLLMGYILYRAPRVYDEVESANEVKSFQTKHPSDTIADLVGGPQ